MPSNRALVVDDSRSARHILGRMLESFGLEVDAVESAELALTYLQTTRPDVIFMDHLMPGMDGFAAVRVIKANPDTATIPVLMYTSQEGEMYLSQARALGAMGVLPKTLKHADVAQALQQLSLPTGSPASAKSRAPEREAAASNAPHSAPPNPPPRAPVVEPLHAAALSVEQAAASMSVPQLAHRIAAEVQMELQRTAASQTPARRWGASALLMGCTALLLLCLVIYQQQQLGLQLRQLEIAQQQLAVRLPGTPVAEPEPVPAALPVAAVAASVPAARVETELVPYSEVPLSGARLEKLRELVESMRRQQIRGTIRVETFMGNFCLTGSPAAGYALADEDMPVNRCDLMGNPFGDALTVQQRQSVAFANLVASVNSNSADGIRIQVNDGGHMPVVAYPSPSATVTAAAWNRVAERNQRVEFTVPTAP